MKEPERSAAELIRRLPDHDDLAVSARVGLEHWETGEITLTLSGTGDAVVVQRRAGEVRRYDGRLSDERLGRIGAELIDHRFTELRAREGDREPDDVPVVLTVERGGKQLHQARLWHGDRYQDRDLDAVLTLVDSLVGEISGGKLPYGG